MNDSHKRVMLITQGGIIAALYVVLTYFAAGFDLASGAIQVRFSEALTILPFFTEAAVPGLFIGCLLANLLTGSAIWDVVFGSLATLIGALGTYMLRRHKILCSIPPVIANAVIVPLVLIYAYGLADGYWYLFATVGIGEVICCIGFGEILLHALLPLKNYIFRTR